MGVMDKWWWPDLLGVSYWPAGIPREETIDAFVQAFASEGYQLCETRELEAGSEKIILYVLDDKPTHAARQLPNGRWTSKLGRAEDIEHDPDDLTGTIYGVIALVLQRPTPSAE